ncbi:ATP-DEPENDENT ZINC METALLOPROTEASE FTSH 2 CHLOROPLASTIC [Salix koriyanagi]|uniref:ATP-DEPENDENT ZINC METALLOPROTEASE FTSH 2 CHLOROPLASTIC n=1 Tax=Salix koriyanagi TaxID=2511006 RepID=A0A9Q0YUN4_9ROSI|nr:ATP-DEPENDENT ZINC METALLOPROTEASE FTSH 2 CHLOROPLASTIC [Salix koriyanagi]
MMEEGDFLKVLVGNVGMGGSALLGGGRANADEQEVSSSRMSYSRFLEYLDKGRVNKVDLFENGTIAIIEAVSPELGNRVQRVRVQLPGLSQELLQKFREKNIDFAAHNAQEDSGSLLFNLIGNLAFPLILIGGLFLLSRRSSGGMGGPGSPLSLGQSKAKFQMEPNTGVTFDDVAGVDEAKQDFVEVVEFLKKPERFTAVGARIQVTVDVPDVRGRTEILKVHAGNKKFDADVSLNVVAMRTPGFSGADLANLLNEAAILAGRRGKTAISSKEIDDSIDRIVAGMEGTVMTDGKSKSLVAYHEVGHAICGTLTPGHDPVQKVTLVPRGQARGSHLVYSCR